jgi:hypothetical protein
MERLASRREVGVARVCVVHWYEEPTSRRQFGEQYESYRRAVPRWWPRREPWEKDNAATHDGRSCSSGHFDSRSK